MDVAWPVHVVPAPLVLAPCPFAPLVLAPLLAPPAIMIPVRVRGSRGCQHGQCTCRRQNQSKPFHSCLLVGRIVPPLPSMERSEGGANRATSWQHVHRYRML
jgi:hypothetical protein